LIMNSPGSFLRAFTWMAAWSLSAAAAVAATPSDLGFDPQRLGRLDAAIEQEIASGRLAGAVMLVRRHGEAVVDKTYGMQDIEHGVPMRRDAIFRIASMSKAVVTVAALTLYEEGRFKLNDPVAKFIPEFADSVVAVPAPEGAADGAKFTTEPAHRPMTIRDLMCHTSGLDYGYGPAAELYAEANAQGWYLAGHDETIGEFVRRLAGLPLAAQPGEKWVYGYSSDVLGYLVEVVSGKPLDVFLRERITGPLKMVDTCFFLPPEKADRLAPVYGLEDGRLEVRETAETTDYIHGPRKCFSGGAGLLSTTEDYARFLQMLLNGGVLDGVRILSPMTVALMHENHVGDLYLWNTDGFGLGFWVNAHPGHYGELIGRGAYGWGSAYFPQYLVDPERDMIVLFMTQLLPAGGSDLNERIKFLTYQALVE